MPRPENTPDWVFPGMVIEHRETRAWFTIVSISVASGRCMAWLERVEGGQERPPSPLDIDNTEMEVGDIQRHFSQAPTEPLRIHPDELYMYAEGGFIHVAPIGFATVGVRSATGEPYTILGHAFDPTVPTTVHTTAPWEYGMVTLLEEEREAQVSFDGRHSEPYLIHRISVGGGVQIILEVLPEPPTDEPAPTGLDVVQQAYTSPQGVSVWDRLLQMRSEGSAASPGGDREYPRRALDTDATPERGGTEA